MPAEKFGTDETLAEPPVAGETNSSRWRQIEALFHQALEHAPADRAGFIAAACSGDTVLEQEVESLLAAHEAGGNLLDNNATDLAAEWSQMNQPSKKPESIGPYQILSQLGKGGMGEVYLATDTRLGRKVALKLLPAEFTNRKERLRRFELEARAASSTNHPNIITIYEIGRIDDTNFIATEFVEGRTLRRLMNTCQFDLREALDIGIQIASALEAAHAAGIRHRDIKPENIMVRPDGLVKVLDFGLAKLAEPLSISTDANAVTIAEVNTEPGVVVGTVQYMSPEQARSLDVDHRTDIFSLGVVLYELVAGRVPFDGDINIEILAAIAHREPEPLERIVPGIPVRLEQIVSRALRKDRNERYQNVTEMLTDLKDLRQELELEARMGRVFSSISRQTVAELRTTAGSQTTRIETVQTDGHKALQSESNTRQRKPRRAGALIGLTVLIIVAMAGALFIARYYNGDRTRKINSLAVMPFDNASGKPEIEYLCDGITDGLISRLSPHLKVISRNATSGYKGRNVAPRTVGRELNVDALLTGRIVNRGDDLLIYIELVSTEDSRQIWGGKYSRRLADPLAEEEIAQDISTLLRLELNGEAKQRLTKRYTANNEAYHQYLNGRSIWDRRRREEYGKAIEYFNRAIEIDPAYALAYAGLADCYVLGGGASSGAEAFSRAKAAAQKALEIDEALAEAHTVLAQTKLYHDWDLQAAESEFKRAIALNPNYTTARQWYADCLVAMGRPDEALQQMRLAISLDPLSLSILRDTGRILYYTGQYDEAITQCRKALDINNNFYPAIVTIGDSLLQKKSYAEAIEGYQKAVGLTGGMALMKSLLAHAYAVSGQKREAQQVLGQLMSSQKRTPPPAFDLAIVFVGLGMKKEAMDLLEKAFQDRYYRLVYIGADPIFDPLRGETRFASLLQGIGVTALNRGSSLQASANEKTKSYAN